MKILHTSDWHLGKRLMDAERLPEQIAALDELADICDRIFLLRKPRKRFLSH